MNNHTLTFIDMIAYQNNPNIKYVQQIKIINKMKTYIGVKMIDAEPMTRGDASNNNYNIGKDKIDFDNMHDEGYLVDYGNYQSWSPKEVFEAAYYPIEDKTKISRNDVESFLVRKSAHKLGDKTCVVLDTTLTGFDTIGTSACVDPANYSQEIGEEIARKDIVNAIWGHLGFVLQWAKNGLKATDNS